jgi:hypothetical protein
MTSDFYPAFESALTRLLRGEPARPAPLTLRVLQNSPLVLLDGQGLRL